ncbi:unnamed protein product, partial [Didymodactylos carnosus]
RRIETIIQNIYQCETEKQKAVEAIQPKKFPSYGPANDILCFWHILEQQNKDDSDEIRMESRVTVEQYIYQNRLTSSEPKYKDVDEKNPELILTPTPVSPTDVSALSAVVLPQPITTTPSFAVLSQPVTATPSSAMLSQPVLSTSSNPAQLLSAMSSQAITATPSSAMSSQPVTATPSPAMLSQPVTATPSSAMLSQPVLSASSNPAQLSSSINVFINEETSNKYQELLKKVKVYEQQCKSVTDNPQRKKLLTNRIKDIVNKLRVENSDVLSHEMIEFLNGKEQYISNQAVRVSSEEGKFLYNFEVGFC